jgi:hypothetical protein
LVAIAVLLVIGVTIGATLLFTRDGDGPSTPPISDVPSGIASANDTGPVEIITEEPTCEALGGIVRVLSDVQKQGWNEQRDSLTSAEQWSPEQRELVESVAVALTNAADQMVPLAKQTPHRVVRELYEQFVAYARDYVASIDTYVPADNLLADAHVDIGNSLQGICTSIEVGSSDRSLAVGKLEAPSKVSSSGDVESPRIFLSGPAPACRNWGTNEARFLERTNDWELLDSNVAASDWTPEQREVQLAALPAFSALADGMESAGKSSGNAVFEDFALLAALYARAYVSAGDKYTIADSWLSYTVLRMNNAVSAACKSAGA